jgi:hypothetical protein
MEASITLFGKHLVGIIDVTLFCGFASHFLFYLFWFPSFAKHKLKFWGFLLEKIVVMGVITIKRVKKLIKRF